jgi:hypothetical protein
MTGARTQEQAATRLFIDAANAAAWWREDFYSVRDPQDNQAALMARMLKLGHNTPLAANAKLPAI